MKAYINGKVYVEKGRYAEAFITNDGLFATVGTNAEIAAAAAGCETIDLKGRTVIPGLNDSHMHLCHIGERLVEVDISGCRSVDELVFRCRTYMEENPDLVKNGMHGTGWNQDLFADKRIPTRFDLDKISTDIPIVLERICGHILAANTKVIEILGLTAGSPQYEGGVFETDENGYPNGIFNEFACHHAVNVIPRPGFEEYQELFVRAADYAAAHGLTSVQSNDVGTAIPDTEMCFRLAHKVYADGKGKIRYRHQCCFKTVEDMQSFIAAERAHTGYNDMLTLGPLKLFKDGSLGARTAMMRHEYLDDPGNYGVEATSEEKMEAFVSAASAMGLQVVTHVIGDDAVEKVINVYEKHLDGGNNTLRHALIHNQITDRPLLEKTARLNILSFYQPIFLDYDMHAVESRCGKELSSTSYAFRTLHELNPAIVSYGTDSPVEDCNPFPCLYSAVTRKDKTGFPEGGFYPDECVDVETAVDCYTTGSAYAEGMEDKKGRIMPGFYADFAVLDRDIFTCDPMKIRDILPVLTVCAGEIAYER